VLILGLITVYTVNKKRGVEDKMKQIILFFAVAIMALLVTGCGSFPKSGSEDSTFDQSKENFVFIRPGRFRMGSPNREQGRKNNEPQNKVTIKQGFYIDKYEVTQKDWVSIMGNNPSRFQRDSLPVENVTFYDAVTYCNKKSQQEGLTPVYTINETAITWDKTANGYRLPTEEEWEYACRAGTKTPFFTGKNITTAQANYDGNYPIGKNAKGDYREETWSVGSGKANGFGLYDMTGNVWEWCWTIDAETKRIVRGGSWYNRAANLRSARRQSLAPDYHSDKTGFRIVLQQPQ
jgi:formylglycine-generating enzyme required for sulfatase activity